MGEESPEGTWSLLALGAPAGLQPIMELLKMLVNLCRDSVPQQSKVGGSRPVTGGHHNVHLVGEEEGQQGVEVLSPSVQDLQLVLVQEGAVCWSGQAYVLTVWATDGRDGLIEGMAVVVLTAALLSSNQEAGPWPW